MTLKSKGYLIQAISTITAIGITAAAFILTDGPVTAVIAVSTMLVWAVVIGVADNMVSEYEHTDRAVHVRLGKQ